MRLATAYVEITAKTEEFRRQVREASRLAEDSGRDIARSLQIEPARLRDSLDSVRRDSSELPSLTTGEPVRRQGATTRLASTRAPRESFFESMGLVPGSRDREQGESAFLKQQLDLERKQVDLLQKQLDLLRELRHGVPAVLT